MNDSKSWFRLLFLVVAPIAVLGIVLPLPMWTLAVAVPVGVGAWLLLFRSPEGADGSAPKWRFLVLAVAIGVAAMVAGETDDSPGLMGLGFLLIAGSLAFGVRAAMRGELSSRRAGS